MYTLFDHTADAGLQVSAPDLPTLFADAARGLSALIIENPQDIQPRVPDEIRIEGEQTDFLLFDWLNELLYRFDTGQMLFGEFSIAVDPRGLVARVKGEKFDPARHRAAHEVKAITYHQLGVEQTADGWEARVIVDI